LSAILAAVDPDEARKVARDILGGRRYRSSPAPRPLRKPLTWIGDRVRSFFHWIGRGIDHVPGLLWLLLAGVALVLVVVFIAMHVRGRRNPERHARAADTMDGTEDPRELERQADAAEREGRLDDALRLRFRAGLLRLGARGAIRYRPSVTTNEVRRVLGSETFDELARTFDAVAYGGRGAATPDLDTARREWPRVVAGATRTEADAS
jgi:hypothetical protein